MIHSFYYCFKLAIILCIKNENPISSGCNRNITAVHNNFISF